MARNAGVILLQIFVLSFTSADPAELRREHERRWNTPPELTPSESAVRTSLEEEPRMRLLSLIPVAAAVSLNTGQNNAHSVSFGASLDGISLSNSNSYDHSARADGSPVSVSQSASVSAGFSGISAAGATARSNGAENAAKTESHTFSLGEAAASAFGMVVENGQAITGAASSVGTTSRSSAASALSRERFFSRYPNRPVWNNVGPDNGHDDRRFDRPTLIISEAGEHVGTRPSLNIHAHDTSRQGQRPRIRIYKWQPSHDGVFPRPSLSIEHQPYHPWSDDQSRGSIGSLRVAASSSSSSSDC